MVAPPRSRLQSVLQAAVQTVQWTFSIFWQFCPQQGILVWNDGYYNGEIKTRKTVQPTEVTTEEATLHRSQQLRELYESLIATESNHGQSRRPSAALSPEDLTESEWFYLMCVSFSFPPGIGLPGKAYEKRQHVWLTGANEVDCKVCSRAILAKSARVQTLVCIPMVDGVVELGTTERVQEDIVLLQHIKSFFSDYQIVCPPNPAMSEHSTANVPSAFSDPSLRSPVMLSTIEPTLSSMDYSQLVAEEEEEEDDDDDQSESEAEAETCKADQRVVLSNVNAAEAPSHELMRLELMSVDIRVGSHEDGSNYLESDFNLLPVSQNQTHDSAEHHHRIQRSWEALQQDDIPMSSIGQPPQQYSSSDVLLKKDDSHYSQTVSTILQSTRWSDHQSSSSAAATAFSKYSATTSTQHLLEGGSQLTLKYVLFTVPLHTKSRDHPTAQTSSRFRGRGTTSAQEDLISASHVMAERRRREKLNERFIILRSLVPFITKMDKASILGDTIEYLKQLRNKIQDLEAQTRQMEADHQAIQKNYYKDPKEQRGEPSKDKKKPRMVEKCGSIVVSGRPPKAVDQSQPPTVTTEEKAAQVEVSIIESDALVELQCMHKEGLLLNVMQMLRKFSIEVNAVESSINNGIFAAQLRAKVTENLNGRKVSIMEVKRAINQIIKPSKQA